MPSMYQALVQSQVQQERREKEGGGGKERRNLYILSIHKFNFNNLEGHFKIKPHRRNVKWSLS